MEDNILDEYESLLIPEKDLGDEEEDEFGVVYSKDGKRLIKGKYLKTYEIKQGTKVICNRAFSGCKSLQQIKIPNSVTNIGNSAFSWCDSLKQVNIPDSVTSIGDFAFEECSSLQQINIPNSVINIGEKAFYGCDSLQQVNIPNSLTCIGTNPFICKDLILKSTSQRFIVEDGCLIDNQQHILISYFGNDKRIDIPNSVTNIGNSAFSECKSLQQVNIPNSATYIGNSAFYKCESLLQVNIPNSVTNIGTNPFNRCHKDLVIKSMSQRFIVEDGCLIDNQQHILISYFGNDKRIDIPNSVTNIGNSAFSECKSLQQVNISNSVTYIGEDAFYYCESLQQIIIPKGSGKKFKKLLPDYLWKKLYCCPVKQK